MKHFSLYALVMLPLVAGCSEIPQEAYYNRGAPESLLDMSSEVVNISLSDPSGVDELIGWINQEQPSRADLDCDAGSPECSRARQALDQFNVASSSGDASRNSVALYYERVLARDCDQRYIENNINPYNLNHPAFGCATAANMVQQVTDKRQFVNPVLMDFADGQKAAQAYRKYMKPSEDTGSSGNLLGGGSKSGSSSK